jgi:TPR repeat protein
MANWKLRRVAFLAVSLAVGLMGGAFVANARESAEISDLKAKAAGGDVAAELALGHAYDSGHGVKADADEAAKWYETAATHGNAEAENSIGSMYLRGEGVGQDGVKACEWFAKSAAQSYASGIGNLGVCYDEGFGVPKDPAKAATLYEQAANAGDLQSMMNIGVDYWRGEGVERDLAKAYMWLDLVRFYTQASGANRRIKWRSRGALDVLVKEMNAEERIRGEALVKEWDKANRDKVQVSVLY